MYIDELKCFIDASLGGAPFINTPSYDDHSVLKVLYALERSETAGFRSQYDEGGFLLTARLGSSRLPRKHLLEVNKYALLEILAKRIQDAFQADLKSGSTQLVIATSDEPINKEFDRLKKLGLQVYYGSKHNIPLRHLQVAQALELDAIIAVDGDDILCSTAAMRMVRDGLVTGEVYANTSGLLLGMNAFGYRSDFLSSALRGNEEKTLETGWGHIFNACLLTSHRPGLGRSNSHRPQIHARLPLKKIFKFFRAVIEHFGNGIFVASDQAIVDHVVLHHLNRITAPIAEKYWQEFRASRDGEMVRSTTSTTSVESNEKAEFLGRSK